MAPSRSFRTLGALVACGATAAQAATQSYQVSEEYTADNFFDKFDFFVSTYTSGDSWDATHGFVQYRSQAEAEALGLISTTSSGAVYIGPDTNGTYNATGTGRDSVRMTSKAVYNQGLMIAEFSHMPAQACGAWPAFWSFGSPWLTMGEIDFYEGWDLQGYNRMAMHTNGSLSGACTLSPAGMTGTILTESCVNDADATGCGVEDDSGVWASATGATFAMEWTDAAIKVWSWVPSSVPSDVAAGSPAPSGWGEPTMLVEQDNCDLASSFANQQLVFDIDFCGDTAGSPTFWDVSCSALSDSCASYVAENPAAFADTYFVVESIKYYELGYAATSSAAVVSATTLPVASSSASAAAVTLSTSTLPASSSSSSSSSASAGLNGAIGSVLESTLGVAAATSASLSATSEAAAVATSTYSHSTGYVYATSVSTDELGSETTVVVTVDTTICPVTAAEASSSSLSSSSSSSSTAIVDAQTTATASATGALAPPSAASSPSSVSSATSDSSPVQETSSTRSVSTSLRTLTLSIPATAITTSVTKSTSKSKSKTTTTTTASTATSIDASSTEIISLSLYTSATGLLTASAATATAIASAETEVISSTDLGSGSDSDALETATASPTSVSLDWLTAATAAAATNTGSNNNSSNATASSAAAKATDTCSGLDCIVVSSGAAAVPPLGGRDSWVGGAGTLALVAGAGIVLLV